MAEDARTRERASGDPLRASEAHQFATPPVSHFRHRFTLSYTLRFADLYWMWETSFVGLAATAVIAAIGLMFLFVPLAPAGAPIGEDIAVGVVLLLVSPFFGPLVGVFASGKFAMIGRTVELVIDGNGLQGWPVMRFRDTNWPQLRHPRLESRVLVLPFSWPFADAWAVVPARAFSSDEFDDLLGILNEHGFFLDGDHRSPMGRLLSLVADHVPFGDGKPIDGHLVTFPRLLASSEERQPGRLQRLRNLGRGTLARRLLVLGGLSSLALMIITFPAETVPIRDRHLTNALGGVGFASITLGLAWYLERSRRIPRPMRLLGSAFLILAGVLLAIASVASIG